MSIESNPRIAIYGVGQYGQHIARMALQNGWSVVAAYNRAGAKVGQDLGRICGVGRDIGVVVEDCDIADFGRLNADIGVVTTTNLLQNNLPAYRRLMNAGLNVICHGGESYFPHGSDPSAAQEIEELALANGVTFTGGGIWDVSRIWAGLLAVGPCTELSGLLHRSVTQSHVQSQSLQQAHTLGVGLTVAEFEARGLRESPIGALYKSVGELVLSHLGCDVTSSHSFIEPITSDRPVISRLLGEIAPGKCIGMRMVSETSTAQGVSCRSEVENRVFQDGDVEYMSWEVDGMPRTRIRVEREDAAHATASCLFNRIPDVIAAPSGIVPVSELGPLTPSLPWATNAPAASPASGRGHALDLSADQLMAAARAITGVDLVDHEAIEPLMILVRAFNEEANLHRQGAVETQGKLLRILANRLRMERDFRAHPEINDEQIIAPVLLGGLPRTGTTKLQKALVATGDFQWLPLWRGQNPSLVTGDRTESPESRIVQTKAELGRFVAASPESLVTHAFEACEADEDSHIMEMSLHSAVFTAYASIPTFAAWVSAQDPAYQYEYLKRTLKYLQWQAPHEGGKPWLLKCPMNVPNQPLLRQLFPDGVLVMTHRHPATCASSQASLLASFHKPFSDVVPDLSRTGANVGARLAKHMENRRAHPELDIVDVRYEDVQGDCESPVREIYKKAGMTFSDQAEQGIRRWEESNPQHAHGVHKYSPEQFGFTKESVERDCKEYLIFLKSL